MQGGRAVPRTGQLLALVHFRGQEEPPLRVVLLPRRRRLPRASAQIPSLGELHGDRLVPPLARGRIVQRGAEVPERGERAKRASLEEDEKYMRATTKKITLLSNYLRSSSLARTRSATESKRSCPSALSPRSKLRKSSRRSKTATCTAPPRRTWSF